MRFHQRDAKDDISEYHQEVQNDECTGWPMSCPCWHCSDKRDYDMGFTKEEQQFNLMFLLSPITSKR
jgi:hypothetical protein